VQGADLVIVGVAQVGQVQLAGCNFAPAGGVFAGGAAAGIPTAWNVSTCSGDCMEKPMVLPLPCVAGSPLMGVVMPKRPVGLL
jgi:hypothetical protein